MAAGQEVAPPPGFKLDAAPPPPPGFQLDGGGDVSRGTPKLGPKDVPDMPAPRAPYQAPSFTDQIAAVPETARTLATNIPAAFAGAATAVGHGLFGAGLGTQEGAGAAQARGGEVQQRYSHQPTNPVSQQQLAWLSQMMEASKMGGMGPAGPGAVARGAPPVAQAGRTAAGMGKTMASAAAPELGMGGMPRPPMPPDPTRALAARATGEYGIPLRPDMLTNNKFARMAGEASEHVPLSGSQSEARQNAFNKAVAKTMGAEGEKLTPDVYAKAMNKYGEMIGDISAKNPIPFDPPLQAKLQQHAFNAAQYETGDVAKIVSSYVKELTESGGAKGQIDGTAFRKLRTKLTGQMRRTTNGDLKHALSELDDDLLDAIQSQLSPKELKQFTEARKYYSNGKTIEPLVAKGVGDISPAALMARVTGDASGKSSMARGTRGDIGELARIGQKFLKEPASSGTAERALTYGLAGGGAAIEPTTAGLIYGGANAYNRLAPWLTRRMLRQEGEIPAPPK